jgi:tRNA(Ile)-lysidine synthase
VEDSSNGTDAFLRNRIRHHVMPVLYQENPQLAKSLSSTAQRLRQDEQQLSSQATSALTTNVSALRQMPQALLHRVLAMLLQQWGVPEPDAEHIRLVHTIVETENPSAWVSLPGGVVVERCYDRLQKRESALPFVPVQLKCPGVTKIPSLGLQVTCTPGCPVSDKPDCFTVSVQGVIWLRPRQEGDTMRLWGGSKLLKKVFIDRKIPASQRLRIPVAADEKGVLGVYGIGPNLRLDGARFARNKRLHEGSRSR